MKIIKGHYYKLINNKGVEYIFQATTKEKNGWIIDIIRTSDKITANKNAFYITESDDTVICTDHIKELDESEILAIKI